MLKPSKEVKAQMMISLLLMRVERVKLLHKKVEKVKPLQKRVERVNHHHLNERREHQCVRELGSRMTIK